MVHNRFSAAAANPTPVVPTGGTVHGMNPRLKRPSSVILTLALCMGYVGGIAATADSARAALATEKPSSEESSSEKPSSDESKSSDESPSDESSGEPPASASAPSSQAPPQSPAPPPCPAAPAPGQQNPQNPGKPGTCSNPGDILDMKPWKLQLPVGAKEKPDEVESAKLAAYKSDPWFVTTADCGGVRFRAAVNGVTTGGSDYPRSELREMGNGTEKMEWSPAKGSHTMVINQAITHLPADKQHVVAGQIHGGSDDMTVFRLEGTKLYVTNGDDAHHKLVIDNYQLGTKFEAKFVAEGGKVTAYFNGQPQTTIESQSTTAYFKAGAYTQANCSNSAPCAENNYGEVEIYDLKVTHA